MKITENDLRGKTVMTEEGLYLGIMRNTTVDTRTGELLNILIEPSDDVDPRLYHLDKQGHLVFPFESIKSVKDVIIIGEKPSTKTSPAENME
ncbi:MAG: PRC-barrel domain protein [Thermoplasmata archaeon]|nr:MAG: PRC-barrel domain protein [Thermoplasmata archaeon]RLF34394.1 MAG: PRC-barrel domain protein [Thermoplasmata archaeon]RLF36733.1 MAG: PRC-barrel domain protein [Thermoplasmata archaeon]